MKHLCFNCAHIECPDYEEPCKTCINHDSDDWIWTRINWEPLDKNKED